MKQETRFSGQWIVAAQGTGKSNMLLHMLASDLQKDACIIIIDPKGDVSQVVTDLWLFDRLITLDPSTVPFALNPLDVPKADTKRAVDQVEYIFGAMLEAAATPKQKALLRSLLRACIIGIPNATLLTIQDLIVKGPEKYRTYIQNLPEDLQYLFDTSKTGEWATYDATRSELRWRLRLLMETDIIQRMFMSPKTRFNLSDAMDAGKVIVIDNSVDKLHKEGSAFLGRYFIAQIWAAATARSSRPRSEKKPVYVYIDEADSMLDTTVAEIIDRCRSQNIALIMAHQRSSQIKDPNVLSALENCAIKMANVDAEAKYFSQLLHIPIERMNKLPVGQFALHVRGEGSSIVSVPLAKFTNRMHPLEKMHHLENMQKLYGPETQTASQKQRPPLEAASRPAADKKTVTISIPLGQAITLAEAEKPILPHDDSDPSAPVKWTRK